jgi:hypothetical protein
MNKNKYNDKIKKLDKYEITEKLMEELHKSCSIVKEELKKTGLMQNSFKMINYILRIFIVKRGKIKKYFFKKKFGIK